MILKKSELTKKPIDRDKIKYVVPNPRYGIGRSYIYFYERHNDSDDSTAWDRFMRKTGEKPVWYTIANAEDSKQDLLKHLNAAGYYQGNVEYKVKQKGKKAKVIYTVDPGKPLKIRSIEYVSENKKIQSILDSVKPLLKLTPGMPLDEQVLIPDQAKLIQVIQDAGYYQVNKSNFEYYYEDSSKQIIDLKCTILPPLGQEVLNQYKISEINIYSNDRLAENELRADTSIAGVTYKNGINNQLLKPEILSNYLHFSKDSLYSLSELQRTRTTFQNLGIYKSVSIIPEIIDNENLRMNLYLPPVKKQFVQVDLETGYVVNKGQAAGNKLFDLRLGLQYRHRNLLKGAEQFSASLIPNIGLQIVGGKPYVPYGLNFQTALTIPRFLEIGLVKLGNNLHLISDRLYHDLKNGARTRIAAGALYDRFLFYNIKTEEVETSIQRETNVNFGYEYTRDNRIFYRFNPVGFDYLNYDLSPGFKDINNQFLLKSFEDRILAGLFVKEISVDINNLHNNKNTSRILLSFESSGLETSLINLFTTQSFLPKIARFIRLEGDGRYVWKLNSTSEFAARIATGIALPVKTDGNNIPFIRQFFVGGPNSIRGWAIREIGPGTIKNTTKERFSFFQTGNFKFEFGSEYRFDIFRWFKGAFLFDGGNVWLLKKDSLQPGAELTSKFLNQLYLSTGAGLRLDFNYFLIRFDAGVQLRTPYVQENGTHMVSKPFKDMQFNISLGLPF